MTILIDKISKIKKEYREALIKFYRDDITYIHQKNFNQNSQDLEKLQIRYEIFKIEANFKKAVLELLESQDFKIKDILIDKIFGIAPKEDLLLDKVEYISEILNLEARLLDRDYKSLNEFLQEERDCDKSYNNLIYKMSKGI